MSTTLDLRRSSILLVFAAILTIVGTSNTAWAQRYGQNPGNAGFIPLANGPVPSADGDYLYDEDELDSGLFANDRFGLGSNLFLGLLPGNLVLTFENVTEEDTSIIGWLASYGDVSLVFESVTGMQIVASSELIGTTLTINVAIISNLNGGFDDGLGIDAGNGFDNGGLPDANPIDDTSGGNNTGFDSSPGNPSAN